MTALEILLWSAVTAGWEAEICCSLPVKKMMMILREKRLTKKSVNIVFYRLEHYMERELIKEENRKSVELAIMVEAGANVRLIYLKRRVLHLAGGP